MVSEVTARSRAHYPAAVPAEIEVPELVLPDLLDAAARDFPDRLAIDFMGRKTSYAKLADRVDRAAGLFHNLGVRRGDVIALVMPNCSQHAIAIFAALRLGAIVAEHNPLAPADEIQSQLARHGAKVVIAWEKSLDAVCPDGDLGGRVVLAMDLTRDLPHVSRRLLSLPLKRTQELKDTMRAPVPAGVGSFVHFLKRAKPIGDDVERPKPGDTAFYLHTGGTTGSPKTVPLTHRNLVAMVEEGRVWLPQFARGTETVGAVLPYFHAFGLTLSLLFAVHMAASQVVFPRFDVEMVLSAQRRRPMTFLPGVPPIFDRVEKEARAKGRSLSSIRIALAGAMSLDAEVARRWEETTGGLIIEGYGMTESSPVALGNPFHPSRRTGTIGVPFPSTWMKVVDQDDPTREVAQGEAGELLLKGPQVFQGYWHESEETAKSLLDDGWLRTGDIVTVDADGFTTIVDRVKELVITGGFNVAPSEVEEVLRQHPSVKDAAVVGKPLERGGEMVVAAVELEDGASLDEDALRAHCRERLAAYKVPKRIVAISDTPRSMLGKVLRAKVREQVLPLL